MRRILVSIFYLIGAVAVAFLEVALLNSPFFTFNHLNLTIVFFVVACLLNPNPHVLLPAILSGLILEQFTSLPFGLLTVSLMIPLVITLIIIKNVVTNRSVWSLFLVVSTSVLGFRIILWFYRVFFLASLNGLNTVGTLFNLFNYIFYNVLITTIFSIVLFVLINRLSRRWNPKYVHSGQR